MTRAFKSTSDSSIFITQCTILGTTVSKLGETKKEKDNQKASTIVLFNKKIENHEADPVDVTTHHQVGLSHRVVHQHFIPP